MQQGPAALAQQIGIVIPPPNNLVEVEDRFARIVFVPNGDQCGRQHKDRDPGGEQSGVDVTGNHRCQSGGVDGQEGVGCVSGRLGPLSVDVRECTFIEPELAGEFGEQGRVGVAQVDPHQRGWFIEMAGHLAEGKVLRLQHTVRPQTGTNFQTCRARGNGGHATRPAIGSSPSCERSGRRPWNGARR